MSDSDARKLVKENFRSSGIAITETALAWFVDAGKFNHIVDIDGLEKLRQAKSERKGVLLLGMHLSSLDLSIKINIKELAALQDAEFLTVLTLDMNCLLNCKSVASGSLWPIAATGTFVIGPLRPSTTSEQSGAGSTCANRVRGRKSPTSPQMERILKL